MEVKINEVTKRFDNLLVIKDLNMCLSSKNGIHCFFGPSGCGKSTLLNIVSGLISADTGYIEGGDNKRISYVFQDDRLLPWSTVEENIEFVLESCYDKSQVEELIEYYLTLVHLSEFKKSYPKELSGGMKQRVAIARALAYDGDIFLMDEPFKGLDFELKREFMDYLINHSRKNDKLLILVTHDIDEALYMADEIFILDGLPLVLKKQVNVDIPKGQRYKDSNIMIKYRKMIL